MTFARAPTDHTSSRPPPVDSIFRRSIKAAVKEVRSPEPNSHRSRTRPLSWSRKILFASITTLCFFVGLEFLLSLLGIQPVTHRGDPFVGFSRQLPLFEVFADIEPDIEPDTVANGTTASQRGVMMHTAPGKLVWFNDQSFSKKKPAGTQRIFCLGGSTTYGRPFADPTSFCGWLRLFLPETDPTQRWEVINAGGISYASYRVAALMEELANYEPDLIVVLFGHNEFLERRTYAAMFESDSITLELNARLQQTRTWSLISNMVGRSPTTAVKPADTLPPEVDEVLNHSAGPKDYHRDPAWSSQVLAHYEWNLNRIVEIARDAGAEVVLLTPAANLRDCSPFKSEHAAAVTPGQREELGLQLSLIESELREGNYQQVLTLSERIVIADPGHADAHFLHGKALYAAGQPEKAQQAFLRAIEEDVCPLRATTAVTEIVKRVAAAQNTVLVDFEASLDELSRSEHGHGCVGGEYFLDHVHPTIDVHRRLAIWIIEELLWSGDIQGQVPSDDVQLRIRRRVEAGIDAKTQGIAFRNLAKVLHWSGKFDEAMPRANDAIRLLNNDLESRFVLADSLLRTGRTGEARAQYDELFRLGDFPRAHLAYGELLSEQGDLQGSKRFLLRALLNDREDHRIRAYYALGLVHLQLGEFDFAVESLRESDRLFPNDPATITLIAEAESGRGDWNMAVNELRRVTTIAPENFLANFRLSEILADHHQWEEAHRHVEIALQLEPDNSEAQQLQTRIGLSHEIR